MEILGLSTPQTILVIEDKLSFAFRLIALLEENNHLIHAFAGVQSVSENMLYGLNPLAGTHDVEVDLSKIQVCFLDHYFEGNAFTGTTLTQVMVPFGVKICGMSSVDHANNSMLRYGAVCAYRKDVLGKLLGI